MMNYVQYINDAAAAFQRNISLSSSGYFTSSANAAGFLWQALSLRSISTVPSLL
jgi:hypothetical protein